MTDKTALEAGTLYPPQLVKELFSKVKGKSALAKVSKQDPVPQEGKEYFVFNLDGNAQIVGEGEQVKAGKAAIAPKVVRPYEIMYQARVSDKFLTKMCIRDRLERVWINRARLECRRILEQ